MSYKKLQEHDGTNSSLETNHAAAIVVIGAFVFLLTVRRGFRGFNPTGAVRVA